jgi:site-specific DNA-methyltransferase (adenine-specific)
MATKAYTIINGDSAQELKHIADNSVDAVVTDPPYGIEFLGKDWDSNTGAVAIWAECLRILKPGGYLLAFSAARTYHHLATNIESVGFEIRDQLMWIYSSGFPKAQDMGKAIQRRMGVKEIEGYADTTKNAGFGQTDHARVRAGVEWSTTETQVAKVRCTDPEAVKWAGWKTALKPGHEPIVMARKRFKGSTTDNIQQHGVGALNIDRSRIPYADLDTPQGRYPSNVMGLIPNYQKYFYCPKVSRRERNVGCVDPGPQFQVPHGFDYRMPSKNNADPQAQVAQVESKSARGSNNHPTVKPVMLMRYLIQLVTPPDSHIVDPFAGSGTTGMAATELGHRFTGIEQDANYVDIARKRIAGWLSKDKDITAKENTATGQTEPFDRLFEQE